jgi:Ni/Co efflux regulator RcnB
MNRANSRSRKDIDYVRWTYEEKHTHKKRGIKHEQDSSYVLADSAKSSGSGYPPQYRGMDNYCLY